jgi:HK97 family phage major capsid protein
VASSGSTVTATASNVLAIGDLYANQAALPPRWRANASWMMNLSIINGYRQLAQATGLNYSIVNDSGPRPTALGWPIYENSNMDGTLTGSAADYLVLSATSSSSPSWTVSERASRSCRTSSARTTDRLGSAGS